MAVIARSSRRLTSADAPFALLAAAIITLGTACASKASSTPSSSPAPAPASSTSKGPKPSPNIITADEIARVNAQNAYEAVQKLRPAMLRPRQVASANGQGGVSDGSRPKSGTATTSGELVVYVDGTRLGDVGQLRGIPAFSIASMRYYSPSEAQMKWGSGHPGGVIEVLSKR